MSVWPADKNSGDRREDREALPGPAQCPDQRPGTVNTVTDITLRTLCPQFYVHYINIYYQENIINVFYLSSIFAMNTKNCSVSEDIINPISNHGNSGSHC